MKTPRTIGIRCLSPSLGFGLGLLTVVALPGAEGGSSALARTPEALAVHARSVLHEIMKGERSWIRIHAAEALIAAGEADAVRAYFTSELAGTESSAFRVGVWRVLATTARSADERNAWIAKAEQIYGDPAAPDRNQAIETLCKLGHRVSGRTLEIVRREAAGTPAGPMVLALWSGQLVGEPNSLERLTGLLASDNPGLRTSAAYALRWLHLPDPAVRQALARAAAAEPASSNAYPYILGAALAVDADPAQTASWVAKLDQVMATGSTAARFEASWTLEHRYKAADLPRVAPLLDLPASENDTRIGAAMIILTTLSRQ